MRPLNPRPSAHRPFVDLSWSARRRQSRDRWRTAMHRRSLDDRQRFAALRHCHRGPGRAPLYRNGADRQTDRQTEGNSGDTKRPLSVVIRRLPNSSRPVRNLPNINIPRQPVNCIQPGALVSLLFVRRCNLSGTRNVDTVARTLINNRRDAVDPYV